MAQQLVLIREERTADNDAWRLDPRTRETGRRGVASARRAMQDAAKRRPAA